MRCLAPGLSACDLPFLRQALYDFIATITKEIEKHYQCHWITSFNLGVDTFADRLRYVRELRQLTQAELARASGVSQSAIANYENRNRKSAKNIFNLADALQVNALWLDSGVGAMEFSLTSPFPAYTDEDGATQHAPWPFRQISPAQWQRLAEKDRTLVESTLFTLIESLLKSDRHR